MRNRIAGIIGIVLVIASLALSTRASGTDTPPPPRTQWMRTTCVTEDSVNCAYNAHTQGNGTGHSFYTVRRPLLASDGQQVGRVVCRYFVNSTYAQRHDECRATRLGGQASRTTHPLPWWMKGRVCGVKVAVNCYLPAKTDGQGGGVWHAAYVRAWDGRLCVFYVGTRRYAKRHDYCA